MLLILAHTTGDFHLPAVRRKFYRIEEEVLQDFPQVFGVGIDKRQAGDIELGGIIPHGYIALPIAPHLVNEMAYIDLQGVRIQPGDLQHSFDRLKPALSTAVETAVSIDQRKSRTDAVVAFNAQERSGRWILKFR